MGKRVKRSERKIAPRHENENETIGRGRGKENAKEGSSVFEDVWEVKTRVECAASQLTIDVMAGRDAR